MKNQRNFTLLEVVIALAILTGGLAGLLTLATQAQNRMAKAVKQWREFHMLEQAAEYYLLQKEEEPEAPPAEIFDYPGYYTECVLTDAEEMPEEFQISVGQAELRCWVITLYSSRDRGIVDELKVDRIDYENVSQ